MTKAPQIVNSQPAAGGISEKEQRLAVLAEGNSNTNKTQHPEIVSLYLLQAQESLHL